MSHFSVLVITENKPTDDELRKILQPWHEFECTGTDDQYVQDVDRTDEVIQEYNESTVRRLVAPDGTLHCPYDDKFYRDPTPEEEKHVGMGTGFGGGIAYTSKDWGDGRGYRAKVNFIPDGYLERDVKRSEVESLVEFIESYYGWTTRRDKYGYIILSQDGTLKQAIDRTNPNAKWDWWTVGGRWSGFLTPKKGSEFEKGAPGLMGSEANSDGADVIRKGDVDFESMRNDAGFLAGAEWDKVRSIVGDTISEFVTWEKFRDEIHKGNIDRARDAYHSQKAILAIREAAKTDRALMWVDVAEFLESREKHVEQARNNATCTFAFVKDGQWVERGEMGWFACVSNETDKSEWAAAFSKMLDELPDSSWLTVVDCHI